jgi:hypothetical protein
MDRLLLTPEKPFLARFNLSGLAFNYVFSQIRFFAGFDLKIKT